MDEEITIMWSDFGINILCIQQNHNINNICMKKPRKSIFNWNHISNKLTEEQIEELKAYYTHIIKSVGPTNKH